MSQTLRKWHYCQDPFMYDIACDKCYGVNVAWSEFENLIWCYDCKVDTEGTKGIFHGPIPFHMCEMLGVSFDRVRMKDGKILEAKIIDNKVVYNEG